MTIRLPARHSGLPLRLNLTEVAGHLTYTTTTVTAWYWLPEQPWPFRADADREALLVAIAGQLAGLSGHRVHVRRTTRPFDVTSWARRLHADVSRGTGAPVPNAGAWTEHLGTAVSHLNRSGHSDGHTLMGVQFDRNPVGSRVAGVLRRRDTDGQHDDLLARVARFDNDLAAFGLGARPATPQEVVWLLYRSVGLGLAPPEPLPTGFSAGDVLALTERVARFRDRFGATTCLIDPVTGDEQHVAVLTVGRMEEIDVPQQHQPWQYLIHEVPFPVEVSSRVAILPPEATTRGLLLQLQRITHQIRDYAEHNLPVPGDLERRAAQAADIRDQVDTGHPEEATRAHGWHRFAVVGDTRAQCLERGADLTRLFHRRARIQLVHTKDQLRMLEEFIPGQPDAGSGYLRRFPVKLFAAGMPQAAAPVGDGRGDLIGSTTAGNKPVMLDLHYPMEGSADKSGLSVFVAEPGGGKSTLIGALGYMAVRRGVQVTLLDPSGPLARLANMPELRGHARVLNLRGAQPGTLAPYALIPTPVRAVYPDGPDGDEEYTQAVAAARFERRAFATDVAQMLLPPQVTKDGAVATALRNAIRQVPAEPTATLEDLVDVLDGMGHDGDVAAKNVANLLSDQMEMPSARLFFGQPPPDTVDTTAPLMVITMAGLQLPDMKIDREHWSVDEQIGLAMLHAANRLAVRRCYSGDMHSRKLVALDETHFLAELPSGRSLIVRLGRDSRKWNLAGILASQNPADILRIDSDIANLVSTVFVGRIAQDPAVAAGALRLLRLPEGVGYEQTLAGLSQIDADGSSRLPYREFMLRDVYGRVGRIRADFSWLPDLMAALNTTPGSTR